MDCFKESLSTDLKYNYSSISKQPERYRFKMFSADETIIPVLTYKNNCVIGYKSCGKGRIIICGLKISDRMGTTPLLDRIMSFLLFGDN